jgi:hypothetical protein
VTVVVGNIAVVTSRSNHTTIHPILGTDSQQAGQQQGAAAGVVM